jgi:hypothetical protein
MDLKKLRRLGFGMQSSSSRSNVTRSTSPSRGSNNSNSSQSSQSSQSSGSSQLSRHSAGSAQSSNNSRLIPECIKILNSMRNLYNKPRYHPNNQDNEHAYDGSLETKTSFINILQTDPDYAQDYIRLQGLTRRFIAINCNIYLNNQIIQEFNNSPGTVDDLIWIVYRVVRHDF